MNKLGYFLYNHKMILLNVILAVFIALLDPRELLKIPATEQMEQNIGLILLTLLFFEFAAIHYKGRWIYSFPRNLDRKTPITLYLSFIPRVLLGCIFMLWVLSAMGAVERSDFFLIPIIVYGAAKEFWVRGFFLNSSRSVTKRPSKLMMWVTEIGFFLFLAGTYTALWEVYFFNHERVMYQLVSPINWVFLFPLFATLMTALQMPFLYDEYRRLKPRRQKMIAYFSILLPVLAFVFAVYRFNFL